MKELKNLGNRVYENKEVQKKLNNMIDNATSSAKFKK